RPRQGHGYLRVSHGRAGIARDHRSPIRAICLRQPTRYLMSRPLLVPDLAVLLQDFFCQHLVVQRNVSPQTVASYRDAFRLLLRSAAERTRKSPVTLTLQDLDAPLILGFLNHLEVKRENSPRSRNARLAAIRSFLRFASFQAPGSLPTIQRVLAIPTKRTDRPLRGFLTREEVTAILAAPDLSTWSGHR